MPMIAAITKYKHCVVLMVFCVLNKIALSQQADPFLQTRSIPEKMEPLSFGDIRPAGWLLQQVQQNLEGFTGHLDSLAPDLLIKDDIYGRNRLTKNVKSKDVGALGVGGDWQVQFLWWNSETQGNWLDGYIRSAILAKDPDHLERVKKHIGYLLSTQDADGYLGIYDRDLRYQFDNENGELWAKTTLLRGLLAWYDYTKNRQVLHATERAVQNVIQHWPPATAHPFFSKKPDVGGLSHGLTFIDVLESLYRITKNETYLNYALFCYKDFSQQVLNEDGQYIKLLDAALPLKGHGVHTYEQLRAVAAAYYISGNPQLREALKNFLKKISQTTAASGGPVGDEWIGGKKADATSRGYEYCSLQELMHSYTELLIKSGDSDFGDRIEKIFFNAAQGSRNPQHSCIAYLKSDNSYYMTGGLNGDTTVKHQTRYKYSPVHQDAAVCCVPNAGRIAPYFIQSMWMKEDQNLVASLLGPCEMHTTINGKEVAIKEQTAYPYDYTIVFEIAASDARFNLKIRKPAWADKFSVSEPYREENGFIVIEKKWSGKQTITLTWHPEPVIRQDVNQEHYFTYGPLVLAHPLKAAAAETRRYPLAGFGDWEYTPEKLTVYRYPDKITTQQEGKLLFTTSLFNPDTRETEIVELLPMGQTILRQVTFKNK